MNTKITLLMLAYSVQSSLYGMNTAESLTSVYEAGHKAFEVAKKESADRPQRKAIIKETFSGESFSLPNGMVEIIADYERDFETASSNIMQTLAYKHLTGTAVGKITLPGVMLTIHIWLKNGKQKVWGQVRRNLQHEISQAITQLLPKEHVNQIFDAADKYYTGSLKEAWDVAAQPLMDLYCEIYRIYHTYYAEGGELPAEQFDPEILKKQIGWLGK